MFIFSIKVKSSNDLCVLDVEPLPFTSGAVDDHMYFYIFVPSLSMYYTDPFMGSRNDIGYHG